MMRYKQLTLATFIVFSITVVVGARASAQSILQPENDFDKIEKLLKIELTPTEQKPPPVTHTVADGETLTIISTMYGTTPDRLFDKNLNIVNPDVIEVGLNLTVPEAAESLVDRPMPTPPPEPENAVQSALNYVKPTYNAPNTYTYGYCTWYVKNRRPDIPNTWGNADTWDNRAPSSGYKVGDEPAVGAIGVTKAYMHVVYIEKVNGDGTVLVSEMNYKGWNRKSLRTAPVKEFRYIY